MGCTTARVVSDLLRAAALPFSSKETEQNPLSCGKFRCQKPQVVAVPSTKLIRQHEILISAIFETTDVKDRQYATY